MEDAVTEPVVETPQQPQQPPPLPLRPEQEATFWRVGGHEGKVVLVLCDGDNRPLAYMRFEPGAVLRVAGSLSTQAARINPRLPHISFG
jgi:hypothetical protein